MRDLSDGAGRETDGDQPEAAPSAGRVLRRIDCGDVSCEKPILAADNGRGRGKPERGRFTPEVGAHIRA
jgi:hypothetical protein